MKNFQINKVLLLFFITVFSFSVFADENINIPMNNQNIENNNSNEKINVVIFDYNKHSKDELSDFEKLEKSEFEEIVKKQLSEDKVVPVMQKGILFIPYLVDSQREPSYLIYNKDGSYVKSGKPGHRVFLTPGEYSLLIGSGPKSSRFTKDVIVKMEQVTVVKPDWSALIVDTTDQHGSKKRKGYLVYNEDSKFLFVSGFGADASKGERTAVWILPPNLYRLTKRGETADSLINYITVRTTAGKAAYVKMIFDSDTGRVLGGGETTDFFFFSGESGWSFNNLFSGVFSFTKAENVQGKQDTQTYSYGAEIKSNINFDKGNNYLANRLEVFEYFQSTSSPDTDSNYLINTRDIFKNNLVGIYRMNNYAGPYVSLSLKTNLFRHYAHDLDNVKLIEEDGTSTVLNNKKSFMVSDYFGTTTLQEGVGLNLEYKYTTILNAFLRTGWGLKQDISRKVYLFNDSSTELTRVPGFESVSGFEVSLYVTSSPFSFLDINIDMLTLFPELSVKKSYFTFQGTVMLTLSSFVSLNYNLWIERNGIIDDLFQTTHALTVQIYYRFY